MDRAHAYAHPRCMSIDDVILLVEDSETDRALTVRELRRFGVGNEVVCAESGIQALDYLFGTDGLGMPTPLPLVMLLDLSLPMLDGVDVLRRVRADVRTKPLPALVLTGAQCDADALQCYTLDADYVLRKPFDVHEWHRMMRRLDLLPRVEWRPDTWDWLVRADRSAVSRARPRA